MAQVLISRLLDIGQDASAAVPLNNNERVGVRISTVQQGAETSVVRLTVYDALGLTKAILTSNGTNIVEAQVEKIDSALTATVECLAGRATVTATVFDGVGTQRWIGKGWADYSHSGTPQAISANVWTTVVNDDGGLYGDKNHLPLGVTSIYDPLTNTFPIGSLTEGTEMALRIDGAMTPTMNNSYFAWRIKWDLYGDGSLIAYNTKDSGIMSAGASVPYPRVDVMVYYIGPYMSARTVMTLEVYCSCAASLVLAGYYIRVN